jgi:AraC-like DNA-binding protein
MKRLKKYCEKHFFENLSIENVFETVKLSIKHTASELRNECLEFMKE